MMGPKSEPEPARGSEDRGAPLRALGPAPAWPPTPPARPPASPGTRQGLTTLTSRGVAAHGPAQGVYVVCTLLVPKRRHTLPRPSYSAHNCGP